MSKVCRIPLCIALCAEGSEYCAVHRWHDRVDELMEQRAGLVAPVRPVTDRIKYVPNRDK